MVEKDELRTLVGRKELVMGVTGGIVYAGVTYLMEGVLDMVSALLFAGAFILTLAVWNHLRDQ